MNLVAMLEDYTKQDIQEIAIYHGMRGFTKYTKSELAQAAAQYMMQPKVMEAYFTVLRDREINVFEKTLENGGKLDYQDVEDAQDFERLVYAGYMFQNEDGSLTVPSDIETTYKAICTDTFTVRRKTTSYLYDCMIASELLYGAAPLRVVVDMAVEKMPDLVLDENTVLETADHLPQGMMSFTVKDNLLIHGAFLQNDIYKSLIQAQGNKDYYMPTLEEIADYSAFGFLPEEPHLKKLQAFLSDQMSMDEEDAYNTCGKIQSAIGSGCKLQEVFHLIEQDAPEVQGTAHADELSRLVNDVWNHTRMVANRGFTPLELNIKRVQRAGKDGRLVKRQERRVQKVYPNAPCPCGSGRKYKHCCGRN